MTTLRLDPDDGRHFGRPMPTPVVPSPFKPEPILHLIQDPDGAIQRAVTDSLNDMIRGAYTDYVDKVKARAAELAEYGLGLSEAEYDMVADPDDPTKVTFRGTWRIVPLPDKENPR